MNNRRKLVIALCVGTLTAPLASFAQQQGKVWRVGYLSPRNRPVSPASDSFKSFLDGMQELGYVEGTNMVIEWRSADGKPERLQDLAVELVNLKVDIIVAAGSPATSAAQKATATIPIVMGSAGDPVGSGFVKSLARPGGNITGLSNLTGDLSSKHLEMVRAIVLKLSHVAVLVNPTNSSHPTILKNVEDAARKVNVRVVRLEARTATEIESVLSTMTRETIGALIVANDPFLTGKAGRSQN